MTTQTLFTNMPSQIMHSETSTWLLDINRAFPCQVCFFHSSQLQRSPELNSDRGLDSVCSQCTVDYCKINWLTYLIASRPRAYRRVGNLDYRHTLMPRCCWAVGVDMNSFQGHTRVATPADCVKQNINCSPEFRLSPVT